MTSTHPALTATLPIVAQQLVFPCPPPASSAALTALDLPTHYSHLIPSCTNSERGRPPCRPPNPNPNPTPQPSVLVPIRRCPVDSQAVLPTGSAAPAAPPTPTPPRPAQVPELRRRRPGLALPQGHRLHRHRHHLRGAEQRHPGRWAPWHGLRLLLCDPAGAWLPGCLLLCTPLYEPSG
jgi:hypothetical protein